EGQTVTLTAADLSASDPDNTAAQLSYTVSNVTHGQFEQVSAPGVAITTFTQAQVNAGQIAFVHDGGETAPTYAVTVGDGSLTDGPHAATITFTNVNDTPLITVNQLTVSEGQTVTLTAANLNASDPDNAPDQL